MNAAENLTRIRQQIAQAASRAHRDPSDIHLVAVSKTKPKEEVLDFLRVGQTVFGENRIAEAKEKFAGIKKDCKVHLIGQIQSNKASRTVGFFDLIHSVDRLKIARKLNHYNQEAGLVQDILLQVNTSGEESKAGFRSLDELKIFLEEAAGFSHLRIRGLMTMAPFVDDEKIIRSTFEQCRRWKDTINQLYPEINARFLSMGMTADFPAAIEEGATHVRIGSALFGHRSTR